MKRQPRPDMDCQNIRKGQQYDRVAILICHQTISGDNGAPMENVGPNKMLRRANFHPHPDQMVRAASAIWKRLQDGLVERLSFSVRPSASNLRIASAIKHYEIPKSACRSVLYSVINRQTTFPEWKWSSCQEDHKHGTPRKIILRTRPTPKNIYRAKCMDKKWCRWYELREEHTNMYGNVRTLSSHRNGKTTLFRRQGFIW